VRHKETPHYAVWRDAVTEMMAIARVGVKYQNLFPPTGVCSLRFEFATAGRHHL